MASGRRVPDRVRGWACDQLHSDELSFDSYRSGLTGTVFRVQHPSGDAWVLRTLPFAAWGAEATRHIASESLACGLLAGGPVPVPRLLAADLDGSSAGAPSSLTTELAGSIRVDPLDQRERGRLAEVAVAIHRTPVRAERPHGVQQWAPARVKVPDFATDRTLWTRAIAVFAAGRPPTPATLVHRDFHPGNVLWRDGVITGVIDWAETAWGPADVDVAHCCTNLAVLCGIDQARDFRSAYLDAGGTLATGRDGAYWQLADAFGFLPDPIGHLHGLLRVRPDLDPATVTGRLEALVADVVTGLEAGPFS